MRIPLGVTATDFNTGRGAVFTSGLVIDPVRASCAYPGMFLPVEIQGSWLAHWHALRFRANGPSARNGRGTRRRRHLKGQWSKSTAPRHYFDVIGQSFAIAQDMMSAVWRGAADVVIEPDVAGFDYDDFKRASELIRVGEMAMRRALPEVSQMAGDSRGCDGPAESASVNPEARSHAGRLRLSPPPSFSARL